MRTTAKADYAVRAAIELAPADDTMTAEQIARATGIPHNFLANILGELRRASLVHSRRGQALFVAVGDRLALLFLLFVHPVGFVVVAVLAGRPRRRH